MEREIISSEKTQNFIRRRNIGLRQGEFYRGIHFHSAIEIVEVKRGVLNCCVNNQTVNVYPNQIILINSNIGHALTAESADIVYTNIDPGRSRREVLADQHQNLHDFIAKSKVQPYLIFSGNQEIKQILKKIDEQYLETTESSEWYLRAYIYELVAFMHKYSFLTPLMLSTEEIEKISPIASYIEKNFKLPITLEDISKSVKYNKYTVCRNFKAVTGVTVFDYINFLRIKGATEKLKQKRLTILQIATDCGFSSVTYFNRVFKATLGCAPGEYRKNMADSF